MAERIMLGGVPIEVVNQAEIDAASAAGDAILICVPAGTPTPFNDNRVGACAGCSTPVIYRPYMPTAIKKACLRCAASAKKLAEIERAGRA